MIHEYVIIKDILNIRSKATEDSDFEGQLLKDTTVWLDERETVGIQPKEGETDKWLTYAPTYFVSKDGLRLKNYEDKKAEFVHDPTFSYLHNDSDDESKWKVSWGNILLDIKNIWNHKTFPSKGENVNIAIIDTGIDKKNADLIDCVKDLFYAPSDEGSMADTVGHGTKSAGLICATGKNLIYGIAPSSNLYVAKRNDIKNQRLDSYHEKSFQWILDVDKKNKIDIVSLSFTCNRTDKIDTYIKEILSRNIIIVAAAGDTGIQEDDLYPACHENVVSIASLTKGLNRQDTSSFNSRTEFILPGEMLLSTGIFNSDRYHSDTSAATPMFVGILALLISLRNRGIKQFTNQTLLDVLISTGLSITEKMDLKVWNWKLPQPLSALLKL